jgi:dipeptidase D
MATFEHLKPFLLWQYFEEITRIPRPSKHEDQIISFLENFAAKLHLNYKKDKIGNLLIYKPGNKSHKGNSTIVLQGHVDMVCEKNADVIHNFLKDPIKPYMDGDWVKAKGTTLGADDGIGVAAMMNVLADTSLEHGPLECLFTLDEETGLTGAFGITPGFFSGNTLLNLDSEDEGILFIGCSGGMDTTIKFKYIPQPVLNNYNTYKVSITGLLGGHSGDEIHKGRGNAIKIMTDFLLEATQLTGAELYKFEGGNLKNAIPREAFATVLVSASTTEDFVNLCKTFGDSIKQTFSGTEPALNFTLDKVLTPETKIQKDFQFKLLETLKQCPHGVIAWSKDIPGLVETSTNLASVRFSENEVLITTNQRSSIEASRKNIADQIAGIFLKAGANVEHSTGYPGWAPNMNSKILNVTSQAYYDLFSEHPKITAIHAGLECGLFLEKYPNLDMISFGPTVYGAHSPDERLHIPSVTKFWDLLVEILKRI